MTLFLCLDDNGGMMFGGRRQSRDRLQLADMLALCSDRLRITPYSEPLFKDHTDKIEVCGSVLSGGSWFIEDGRLIKNLDGVETLILYKWNRIYPADVKFGFIPKSEGFTLTEITEFEGSSHDKITRETYKRRV